MKRHYFFVAALFMACTAGIIGLLMSRHSGNPQPIEITSEESDNYTKRLEWINEMHRTAPGVDWREMDEQTRWEMYQERLPALQEAARDGQQKGARIESIADGFLTGQWIEKGSNNLAGRVHCVDIDFANNRLYAASDGGQIWAGTLDGQNWVSLSDPFRIDNIQFIRAFPNAIGSTRVLASSLRVKMNYSDDMGTTWISSDGLSAYYNGYDLIRSVSQADGTLYILAYKSGYLYLFRSKDLGNHFSRIIKSAGSNKSDIWTNRFGSDSVYLIDRNQIFSLKDSTEWTKIADVNLNFAVSEIQQVQLAGNTIAFVTKLYTMYRLEKSTLFYGSGPNGSNWTYRGTMDQGPFMSNSFGASPTNPDLLGFGGLNADYSIDGGVNWKEVNSWGEYYGDVVHKLHADIPEVEFFKKPDGTDLVFISTDGGSFVSVDQMQSVTNVSLKGLNISQYYSTFTHRTNTGVIYAGSQDQGFQKSWQGSDGIVDFDQTISGDYGHVVSGDGGTSMWTVYPGFAMYYPEAATSNGASMLGFDEMKMKNQFWMPPLLADPYFPDRVYVAGGTSSTGCHIWYLEYKSGSITATEYPVDFSNGDQNTRIASMAFSPINKDYRYVLNSAGKFFTSTDRGTTYTQSTNRGPDSHYFYGNSIVPSPRDINTIWLAGSGYSGSPVWVSHDGGETFQTMSTGLKNSLIFEMTCNEDGSLLFAASEVGPWVYIAAKNHWYNLSGVGAPQQTYWAVDYVPALRTARFGTYGRGIWDFKIATFSGLEDVVAGNTGLSVSVYPNPCSDWLMVSSSSLVDDHTVINILTLDGRTVQTISQAESIPVRIEMAGLPAGVYLVSVSNGGKRETVRVVKE
ncbi:MAG: T9SS C-terminal target domain-containing protein [Porphyromonadaceae bacterium]|nr:MAG: T9SS C-terminal target domain-containing protein [Porphyromonadaceae bacterium]